MAVEKRRGTPTAAEVRRVAQPATTTGRDVEHWTASLYLRRLSPHITRLLLWFGASANTVTVVMIATGLLAGASLLVSGVLGALFALVLSQLQMLWDCCDGEVARWRRQQSAVGVFLDRLGHYGAELCLCLCLGLRVGDLQPVGAVGRHGATLGALLAALVLLNRAVNDMVHASRAVSGLPPLGDNRGSRGQPTGVPLARLRAAARFFPIHRAFHSVELTILVLLAAVADTATGRPVTAWLLVALVPAAAVTVVGHVTAVVSSQRLR